MGAGWFWFGVSTVMAILCGSVLALAICSAVGYSDGCFAGVAFAWVVFHLGLLLGGMAIISAKADAYKLHK